MIVIASVEELPLGICPGYPNKSIYTKAHGHYRGPFLVLRVATEDEWMVNEDGTQRPESSRDYARTRCPFFYEIHVD